MKKYLEIRKRMIKPLEKLEWIPPLLARLTLGFVFIESGWGKLHNTPKVTNFFISLGLPLPAFQAHLVAWTEFCCGTLVLLGLLTRLASIPLIVVMTVAMLTAKKADIHEVSDLLAQAEYLYIILLLMLTIQGAGRSSLDNFFLKKSLD